MRLTRSDAIDALHELCRELVASEVTATIQVI